MVAGRKIMIGEENTVFLSLNNGCLCTNPCEQTEITNDDENMAEGRLFFTTTCSCKGKAANVTNGFFRKQLANH